MDAVTVERSSVNALIVELRHMRSAFKKLEQPTQEEMQYYNMALDALRREVLRLDLRHMSITEAQELFSDDF